MTPGQLYTYIELQKILDDRVRELVLKSVNVYIIELEKLKTKWSKKFKNDQSKLQMLLSQLENATAFLPAKSSDIINITHDVNELPIKNTMKKRVTITVEVSDHSDVEIDAVNWLWSISVNASALLVTKPEAKLQKVARTHINEIRKSIVKDVELITTPQKEHTE